MKLIRTFVSIVVSIFLVSIVFNSSNQIITNSKEYFALNDSKVSTRELAILASLAYEDVPSRCANKNSDTSNCFYESKDIVGMSEEKAKSLVSDMTLSLVEPGEAYYYLNYTTTKQMKDAGWIIYDYATESVKGKTKEWLRTYFPNSTKDFNAAFDVVTFKKGNNYVIAFRGTDFPKDKTLYKSFCGAFFKKRPHPFASFRIPSHPFASFRVLSRPPRVLASPRVLACAYSP